MSKRAVLLWVVCLAFLSVGARNFESGLSLDAPLYASIAREIVRTGNWLALDARTPDFVPFAEHPHLGFWIQAAWFLFFPATDWSARIPGHLMYVAFLVSFFLFVRRKSSEKIAALAVILLWSWFIFSNTFSNVYLDPAALLFGAWAIFLLDLRHFAAAGLFLGLCVLVKGFTILGFLPAVLYLGLQKESRREFPKTLLSFFLVVGSYCALLTAYQPDFLPTYWARQVTHRFARRASWAGLFSADYWRQLLSYTYYLAPLSLLALKDRRRKKRLILPVLLAASFIGQFAMNYLAGGQYLIMVMPWLAWLIAEGTVRWIPGSAPQWAKASAGFAIAATFLLQYIPLRTHAADPLPEQIAIRKFSDEGRIRKLLLDLPPNVISPFVLSGAFGWYGNVPIAYPGPLEKAADGVGYFLHHADPVRLSQLAANGWCVQGHYSQGSLWLACP